MLRTRHADGVTRRPRRNAPAGRRPALDPTTEQFGSRSIVRSYASNCGRPTPEGWPRSLLWVADRSGALTTASADERTGLLRAFTVRARPVMPNSGAESMH